MKALAVARSLVTGLAVRATGTRPRRMRSLEFGPFAAALDARPASRRVELDELSLTLGRPGEDRALLGRADPFERRSPRLAA